MAHLEARSAQPCQPQQRTDGKRLRGRIGRSAGWTCDVFRQILRQADPGRRDASHRTGGYPAGESDDARGERAGAGGGGCGARGDGSMKLVHGGDTVGYREKYGRDAVDFSANVSPLGMPTAVAQAIGEAAYHADRYPDPLCRELCAAIARAENVPAEWVLCGNGAADLIFRLALSVRPRRALILSPTFADGDKASSVTKDLDRKSTRLNSSHVALSRMPSSA